MRLEIRYDGKPLKEEDRVIAQAYFMLLDAGIDVTETDMIGAPRPKRPR